MSIPYLVYVSGDDAVDHPEYSMVAAGGKHVYIPYADELINFPSGAIIHSIAGTPLAFNMNNAAGGVVSVEGHAIGVELPLGYIRLASPAIAMDTLSNINELGTLCAAGWDSDADSLVTTAFLVEKTKSKELRLSASTKLPNSSVNFDIVTCIIKSDDEKFWTELKLKQGITHNAEFKDYIPSTEMIDLISGAFDSFSVTVDESSELPQCKNLFNKSKKIYSILRWNILPGFSDRRSESEAFLSFLSENSVDLLLLANRPYNKDIADRLSTMPDEDLSGIKNMLRVLKKGVRKNEKTLRIGTFYRKKCDFLNDAKILGL